MTHRAHISRKALLIACVILSSADYASGKSEVLKVQGPSAGELPAEIQLDSVRSFLGGPSRQITFPQSSGVVFCASKAVLPVDAAFIGCWVIAESAPVKLEFVFSDKDGRKLVAPAPGGLDLSWQFRGVPVPDGAALLEGVNVAHPNGVQGKLWIGEWMADSTSPSAHEDLIWQLKSYEFSKRFTFFRTARQFLWDGFNEVPFLPLGRVLDSPDSWFILPEEAPYQKFGNAVSPGLPDGVDAEIELSVQDNQGRIVDVRTFQVESLNAIEDGLRRLQIPITTPGSYRVKASVYRDGTLLGSRHFVLNVFRNTGDTLFADARNNEAARIERTGNDGVEPVFDASEQVSLDWGGQVPGGTPLNIQFEVYSYSLDRVAAGSDTVPVTDERKWTWKYEFPDHGSGAYYLRISAFQDDRLVAQSWSLFGVRPAEQNPEPLRAPATFDELFGGNRGLSMQMEVMPLDNILGANIDVCVEKNVQAESTPILCFYWGDVEPLPGVYQFDLIEERLAALAKAGKRAFISPWVVGDSLPEWTWYDACLNQQGTARFAVMQGSTYVSPSSALYRDNQKQFIAEFVRHFRGNPTVLGYYFPHNGAEGFYPYLGDPKLVPDYSESARTAFQAYLREDRELSLGDLNARYSTKFKSWEELECPLPDFESSLDLRPVWQDFMSFQQHVVNTSLARTIATVRREDPDRPLIQYALWGFGAIGQFISGFRENNVVLGNGGSDVPVAATLMSVAKNDGVTVMGESTHTPPFAAALNLSSFNTLANGRFQAFDLCWNHLAHRYAGDSEIDRLLDYYRYWQTNLIPELSGTTPVGKGGAVLFSPTSQILRTRFFSALGWSTNAELAALYSSFQQARWIPTWISEENSDLSRFPVIWDTGIAKLGGLEKQRIMRYVNEGGNFITSLSTDAVPSTPAGEPFELFRDLGFEFVQKKPLNGVEVTLQIDSPFGLSGQVIKLKRCWPFSVVPKNAEVLAKDLKGRALLVRLPLGTGTIFVAAGELDLRDAPHLFASLRDSLDGRSPLSVSKPEVWSSLLRDSQTSYVALLSRPEALKPYMNVRESERLLPESAGTWTLDDLAADTLYQITDLVSEMNPITRTGAEIREGLPFLLKRGGMAVYKIAKNPQPTPE